MHEQYARHNRRSPTEVRLPTQLPARRRVAREFAQTDLGNAERLLDQHGTDLRYCAAWKQWLCWDGKRWRPDETNQVMERAKQTVRNMYAAAAQIEHKGEREQLVAWAQSSESAGRLKAMVELAKSVAAIQVAPDELDRDPYLLNVQNGTIDLRTGHLLAHRREHLISKLAPVAFDPGATCPTWLTFLDQIMGGSADLIGFLQRAIGYSLTGDVRERVFFFLQGEGRNGKSTLLEALRKAEGDYAATASAETLLAKDREAIRNDVARLRGARLVSVSETEQGRRLAESFVKHITGGDTITARFLYSEHFEFRPTFKIWLGTNYRPVVRGTDPAIWDRIRLIPFSVRFWDSDTDGPAPPDVPLVDKALPVKLEAELPGILRWAVEGCLAWQQDGLGTPPQVRAATEDYRVEMDVLAHFLDERTVSEPGAQVAYAELYTAYQAWAKAAGEFTISRRLFNQRLTERGLEGAKSTGGRYYWKGLRLTPTPVPSVPIGPANLN